MCQVGHPPLPVGRPLLRLVVDERAEGPQAPTARGDVVPRLTLRLVGRAAGLLLCEGMTVAQINEAAPGWNRPMLEAALEYEQAHGKRKGAISALEHALAAKEDD